MAVIQSDISKKAYREHRGNDMWTLRYKAKNDIAAKCLKENKTFKTVEGEDTKGSKRDVPCRATSLKEC